MQSNKNVFYDFLKRRKVSDPVIKEFGLSVGNHYELGECLVIPVSDMEGNFSFNKYRRSPLSDEKPKYLYDKGGKVTLYGAFKLTKQNSKTVLVTEGEMDSLVAWSANIPAVSGTGGSMTFKEEWSTFFEDKETILCFDNDSSGGEGMARALKIVPHAKICFLPDRPGIKDISDYVTNGGDLHALLKTAKHFKDKEDVLADKADRESMWLSTFFHDAFIKLERRAEKSEKRAWERSESDDALVRAKSYPVDNLISFDRQGNAKCLWHNERSGSLHYYKDSNNCYCFGACGRVYDSVDIYMALHKCKFKEAVLGINKLSL